MIRSLEIYNPSGEKTRHKKQVLFSMQKNYTKEEELLLLHLKMVHFHYLVNIHLVLITGKKTKWIY